jgi:hypothetical protein
MKVLKEKLTQAVICLQLITALLGGIHHGYQIWQDFSLGNRLHSVSINMTLQHGIPSASDD